MENNNENMNFVKGRQVECKVLALLVTLHRDFPSFLQGPRGVAFAIYIKEIINLLI